MIEEAQQDSSTGDAAEASEAPIMPAATIGRMLWYYPAGSDEPVARNGDQPHSAQVVCVWGPAMVNLAVFDAAGKPYARSSVPIYHPAAVPDWQQRQGGYATWMPYQVR